MTLRKDRTTRDFLKRFDFHTKNSREYVRSTINNFVKFTREIYQKTPDQICAELVQTKKTQGEEEYEEILYQILQEWVDWNVRNKAAPYTIKTRLSTLRGYLHFLGVKTDPQDIKLILKIPKRLNESRHPLTNEELQSLVLAHSRNPRRQALYLGCSSSGMRIGEALQIRKCDLDFSYERIMVRIKAEYTKTKTGLITFVSKECEKKIRPYLPDLGEQDLVFTNSKGDLKNRERTEQAALARARKSLGLDKKYSSNGFALITTHNFRAFFFTRAARVIGEDYAQLMTGHAGYLLHEYDRMTEKDKLEQYLKLESELVVFDQTKNEMRIKKLENEKEDLITLKDKMKKLQEIVANHDRKILENLVSQGKIPSLWI